jgi:cytochrome c oxidase assembly factor CtaG
MPLERADVTRVDHSPHLSPGVWIAAGAEIGVAVGVATLILHTGETTQTSGRGSSGMGDMHPPPSLQLSWPPGILIAAVFTAAMLICWLATRARLPAILAAAGLVGLITSEAVRAMALQSHLVAMAALEALLVAVPLLLIAAVRRRDQPTAGSGHSRSWTAWVIIAVALNSALLIVLHLPAVHGRAAQLGVVPLWLTLPVVVVGLSYWAAILIAAGRVRPALRRGALIIGQEVAAILGLAALLRPFPHMQHATPLGLSPTMDQRLGGILMLVTCAAVTLPLANRLKQEQATQHLRMEHNVH